MEYQPGKFGVPTDPEFVSELWAALNEPTFVQAMTDASDSVRPAIEAVRDKLLERFPDKIVEDRNKQLAGHMVRQIMEHRGYELVSKNERVDRFPFSRAALYRKRGAFELFVFRSSGDPRHVCVSAKRSKASLPSSPSKDWAFWTVVDSKLQAAIALGAKDVDDLVKQVRENGFVTLDVPRIFRRG